MTMKTLNGLHHVTALARDPIENIRFYAGLLGLRFVKRTVNFDDPSTWHLYYGDQAGHPGTVMTFFPHPHLARQRAMTSIVSRTLFAVRPGSLVYWEDRLRQADVEITRAGDHRLHFEDHDGTVLGLVETEPRPASAAWAHPTVPAEHQITGFAGAALRVPDLPKTRSFLVDVLGFRPAGEIAATAASTSEGARPTERLVTGTGPDAGILELEEVRGDRTSMGAGSVHHLAWRVADRAAHLEVRDRLLQTGVNVTPVIDRNYFESIYFRIPGGVIFEIATDAPGFTIDEPLDELGRNLKLPAQYEGQRPAIAASLPPIPEDISALLQ